MSRPLVSVCLPNLNTLPYLRERVDTILAQTYDNWELIVSDNFSDDGAWEFFQALAKQEARVSIAQAPREGLYPNWNRCIERARGEYVYIATSDDTMPPDCLAKLVEALEAHPECDVAHCPLRVIDEQGTEIAGPSWPTSIFARSSGPLLRHRHVRRAPYDGLLHLLGGTIFVSITQLLIRRSLFERIGLFESRWGSVGDFNWDMRMGLAANVVHEPDTWGGWRIHRTQATAGAALGSPEHSGKVDAMIDDALQRSEGFLTAPVRQYLNARWVPEAQECRTFLREVARLDRSPRRKAFIVRRLMFGSPAARQYVKLWMRGQVRWADVFPNTVQGWLNTIDFGPALVSDQQRASRSEIHLSGARTA